jgi:hypothetical protein
MQATRITALGGVFLASAVVMIQFRLEDSWAHGTQLVVAALCCAFLFALALSSPNEEDGRPTVAQSALYVAGLVLLVVAAVRLGQVARGSDSPGKPGTVVWLAALYTLIASYPAVVRGSAVCALISALAFGVLTIEFVDWVDPGDLSDNASRWILFGLMVLYGLFAVVLRSRRPRYAAQFVNAAMVAVFALAEVAGVIFVFSEEGGRLSTWWELVMLLGSTAGIAYAIWTRERGPAWVGGTALVFALITVAVPAGSGGSLVGWPLVLLILATLTLVVGMAHPRRT